MWIVDDANATYVFLVDFRAASCDWDVSRSVSAKVRRLRLNFYLWQSALARSAALELLLENKVELSLRNALRSVSGNSGSNKMSNKQTQHTNTTYNTIKYNTIYKLQMNTQRWNCVRFLCSMFNVFIINSRRFRLNSPDCQMSASDAPYWWG